MKQKVIYLYVFIIRYDMKLREKIQVIIIVFIFWLVMSNSLLMTTMFEVNIAAQNTTRCNLDIVRVFLRNMFREFLRRFYSFCASYTFSLCGKKSVSRCLSNWILNHICQKFPTFDNWTLQSFWKHIKLFFLLETTHNTNTNVVSTYW